MTDDFNTLLRLIALNGKDVGPAIFEFLHPKPDSDLNLNQAAMLGWVKLLNMQTSKLLKHYDELPENPVFQESVLQAFHHTFKEYR